MKDGLRDSGLRTLIQQVLLTVFSQLWWVTILAENLYDVFVNIREDEAQHCRTMHACQSGSSLRSPHQDVPLTELARAAESVLPPVDCEGLFECATTATSSAERVRKNGVPLAATKSDRGSQ